MVAGPAGAAGNVKKGFYHCWTGSTPEGGTIKIRKDHKYSVHGDVGRYKHATDRKWIKFVSGPLDWRDSGDVVKGKHIIGDSGAHIIEKWVKFSDDSSFWWFSTCSWSD